LGGGGGGGRALVEEEPVDVTVGVMVVDIKAAALQVAEAVGEVWMVGGVRVVEIQAEASVEADMEEVAMVTVGQVAEAMEVATSNTRGTLRNFQRCTLLAMCLCVVGTTLCTVAVVRTAPSTTW